MAKVNWGRLLLGSLIAAVLCFVTDGLMHNMLIHEDWKGVYTSLKATPPTELRTARNRPRLCNDVSLHHDARTHGRGT